jgi:UDP-GlcNAc:undecaprenyl-phosphate/decaprenyl-phosphate GlcNAc-1-phosphate transferase
MSGTIRRDWRFPTALNYRGERLPLRLGFAIALGAVVAFAGPAVVHARLAWVELGIVVVYLAGLYDDSRATPIHGIRKQLRAALRGRITGGVVKLAVVSAASLLVAWMLGPRGWRAVVGAGVLAGCANLWNLLDVRPGRALKAFIPVAVALAIVVGSPAVGPYAGLAAGGAIVLIPDLRERAMLGDGGANVLGFVVGVGCLLVLETSWLVLVLAAVVVLHALADTITLSRIIDRTPPLRWLDGLGRRKFDTTG